MYKKFSHKELVSILWDVREIPEFLDELTIAELKQFDNFLFDWELELWQSFTKEFKEKNSSMEVYNEFLKNGNKFGVYYTEIKDIRNRIQKKIDPIKEQGLRDLIKKLSGNFDYKFPTTKYTIIYHFMKSRKRMPLLQKQYLEYIRSNFDLEGKKFNRLAFDSVYDKRYIQSESVLLKIYNS